MLYIDTTLYSSCIIDKKLYNSCIGEKGAKRKKLYHYSNYIIPRNNHLISWLWSTSSCEDHWH